MTTEFRLWLMKPKEILWFIDFGVIRIFSVSVGTGRVLLFVEESARQFDGAASKQIEKTSRNEAKCEKHHYNN